MKDMKARQKTALRNAILLQLQAAYPASMPDYAVWEGARISGVGISEAEISAELEYLCELGFVRRQRSELSEGLMRSRLSAKGIGYLERNGF